MISKPRRTIEYQRKAVRATRQRELALVQPSHALATTRTFLIVQLAHSYIHAFTPTHALSILSFFCSLGHKHCTFTLTATYLQIPTAKNIPLGEIPKAVAMPPKEFEKKYGFAKPAKNAPIVLYCRAGVRSEQVSCASLHSLVRCFA